MITTTTRRTDLATSRRLTDDVVAAEAHYRAVFGPDGCEDAAADAAIDRREKARSAMIGFILDNSGRSHPEWGEGLGIAPEWKPASLRIGSALWIVHAVGDDDEPDLGLLRVEV